MHLKRGGAPAGPAGTGKTESATGLGMAGNLGMGGEWHWSMVHGLWHFHGENRWTIDGKGWNMRRGRCFGVTNFETPAGSKPSVRKS